jgi:deoxyribodipyrimidine photo-lyase
MTTLPLVIHWFRQDLRLADNPALVAATQRGRVLPLYVLDDGSAGEEKTGAAARWWLHHSLKSLNQSFADRLCVRMGNAETIVPLLASTHNAAAVFWNRCYEPWRQAQDEKIKKILNSEGVEVYCCNGALLWEPQQTLKADGTPYKIFMPFYRNGCWGASPPRKPQPAPVTLKPAELITAQQSARDIDNLNLLPAIRWDRQLIPHWNISEAAAQKLLFDFVSEKLKHYKTGRDFPAQGQVSRLSPYLHAGQLSPNQAWHAAQVQVQRWRDIGDTYAVDNAAHFFSELGWREFSHSLLYHVPRLPDDNLQEKFNRFPWRDDEEALHRWQRGQTGFPIVDAGMRELWQTGYMHNRLRMIVGSFLVKNLLVHWHYGKRWFWDCLVDADLANNSVGWQWIAGCGADAAPYFRIFNPVMQGQKCCRSVGGVR